MCCNTLPWRCGWVILHDILWNLWCKFQTFILEMDTVGKSVTAQKEDISIDCVHSSVQRWHIKTWSCGQQSVGIL